MKFPFPKNLFVWIPIVMVVVAIPTIFFLINKDEKVGDNNMDKTNSIEDEKDEKNPAGTIVVEAGEGFLEKAQYDSFSYVGESARGLEAYLGGGGTVVIYNVEVSNPGKYSLWAKLSDDGFHDSGARSATVVINNSQTLGYIHISEDTKGWKWYKVGDSNYIEGMNTVVFTKNETTTAAYVMDEFKLIPAGDL